MVENFNSLIGTSLGLDTVFKVF